MNKLQFTIQATNRITLIKEELKEHYQKATNENVYIDNVFNHIFDMYEKIDLLKDEKMFSSDIKDSYLSIIKEILKELKIIVEDQDDVKYK